MTGRMIEAAKYYKEGDTKGNLTQSMLKANYSKSYATTGCDKLSRNNEFRKALGLREAEIDDFEHIKVETLDKDWEKAKKLCLKAKDRTNYIRCLENQGKHEGYYAKDKDQPAEVEALTAKQEEEAQRIANIRLREGA